MPEVKRRKNRHGMLPSEVSSGVIRMAARGATWREIADELHVSFRTIGRVIGPHGGTTRPPVTPSGRFLSQADRVEIFVGLQHGLTQRQIGKIIDKDHTTVGREIRRHGGKSVYRPIAAHEEAYQSAHRPKATKLAANEVLCSRVIADLERWWSPTQISGRLREEFGDDPAMNISHETIYQSLYVQGRGELRRELSACLRTGRAKRQAQGRVRSGPLTDKVMIADRPAEIEDRAVPGHWEGDLIIGKNGKSAIGTLVERTTRTVLLLHLDGDRTAETVRLAMVKAIATLPEALRRSITWDQGVEMAQHLQFTIETGIPIYFCDPHAPWERGTNENTNGLLRQYFPKGTDLSLHTPEDLQAVADSLNSRPRQTLGWKTPSETLTALLGATTT